MELATRKCFIERNVQFEEDQLLDPPQSEAKGGINTLPFPFDDDILSYVSNSYEEEQYQHDLDIEAVPHENLDRDPAPIPNQCLNPTWSCSQATTLSIFYRFDECSLCFFFLEEEWNAQFFSSMGQIFYHSLSSSSISLEVCCTTL